MGRIHNERTWGYQAEYVQMNVTSSWSDVSKRRIHELLINFSIDEVLCGESK